MSLLSIENLDLFYGDAQALDQVSLEVEQGHVVAIIGANGAGKTSLIRTIAGIHRPRAGRITFEGADITGFEPHRTCDLGIGQVAEGRQVFPTMTVLENRPSQSKPDRGVVRAAYAVTNQRGETVMTMEGMGLFRRKGG